ncbi:cilia- and flagella-associated protein 97 [Eurosta solidaginis]|uniref:cilia- and flagella-associated protein 97 n=1 Tax=Eurosta solidaginis TaxID=178769 RepID=UPI0035312279
MSDTLNSDEDKYANESFENDTDEIPEVSETESDSENEATAVPSNSTLYDYARSRFNGRKNSLKNRNYVSYDSTSEDEDDVVISETIVEINTEPMYMDNALQSPESHSKSALLLTRHGSTSKLRGKVRIPPSEPLVIAELPKSPKIQIPLKPLVGEDTNVTVEVSDNEDAQALATKLIAQELIQQFQKLTCATKESPKRVTANNYERIVLESNALSTPVLSKEEKDPAHPEVPSDNLNDLNTPLVEKYQQNVDDFYDGDNIGDNQPEDINNELYQYEQEQSIDVHITSQTPTSFNSDDYAFHLNFLKQNASNEKLKMRTAQQRKSWSFSNDRMREIERHNHILLRKILSQKPTYHLNAPKPTKFATLPPTTRITSAAVNRKKKQRQIDLDNQGLKRRIEAISLRRPAQRHLN